MPISIPNLNFLLPEAEPDAGAQIQTSSVTGTFGITAAVSSFDEVLEWQEKRKGLSQGYFRLVHPPRTQRLLASLRAHYAGWAPLLFASPELALKEWAEFSRLENGCAAVRPDEPLPSWASSELLDSAGIPADGGSRLLLHAALPEHIPDGPEVVVGMLANPVLGCRGGVLLMRDEEAALRLYERNRRRGGVLSGRVVAQLTGETADRTDPHALEEVCRALCVLEGADAGFSFVSGMHAITTALDLARKPGKGHFVVLGHVYRDSHILLEEMEWDGVPMSASFLAEDAVDELATLLASRDDVAAVFVETITNPLMQAPDLPGIIEVAKRAGTPVIVDNTMATPANCQPLRLGADVVLHSTSKYLSGTNQHGGGIILSSDPVWIEALGSYQGRWQNQMAREEAVALLEGVHSFEDRMKHFEANGRAVRRFLRSHPAVAQVFPTSEQLPAHLKGWGSVVSCLLREDNEDGMRRFFDSPLEGIPKAPSLGSDQTLFCPYILLTYFDSTERDLQAYGLHRYLVRIAVGAEEDLSGVLESLDVALRASGVQP